MRSKQSGNYFLVYSATFVIRNLCVQNKPEAVFVLRKTYIQNKRDAVFWFMNY